MSNKDWDKFFLGICDKVAENSKCLSRKIGAIMVKDKSIISTGYNGPPRGIPSCSERLILPYSHDTNLRIRFDEAKGFGLLDGVDLSKPLTKCPRQLLGFKSGEGLGICVAGHAERNTLINAAREGIQTKGAKLYMNCNIPCTPCLIEIINAGIEEIIVKRLKYYDESAEYLMNNSKLKVRTYEC